MTLIRQTMLKPHNSLVSIHLSQDTVFSAIVLWVVCNSKYWFQIVCGVKLVTSIFTGISTVCIPFVFVFVFVSFQTVEINIHREFNNLSPLCICLLFVFVSHLYLYLYFFKLLTSIFTENSTIYLPFVPTINHLWAALPAFK